MSFLATAIGVDGQYRPLVKPGFNPPDRVFAPVWSILFFGLQQLGLALVEIHLLRLATAICVLLFWRVERLAGCFFLNWHGLPSRPCFICGCVC